ncbi:hypothetical protein CDAR_437821 [Caerostris darwini]|uniref:Uncharacterized protein n=1 Tax=Caerostris darwini TaxID=1538125 RepID=A0AAV4NT10_9ARAC|nr:hypothetical protein CDAR_437821 [Caerostris darwini]
MPHHPPKAACPNLPGRLVQTQDVIASLFRCFFNRFCISHSSNAALLFTIAIYHLVIYGPDKAWRNRTLELITCHDCDLSLCALQEW